MGEWMSVVALFEFSALFGNLMRYSELRDSKLKATSFSDSNL